MMLLPNRMTLFAYLGHVGIFDADLPPDMSLAAIDYYLFEKLEFEASFQFRVTALVFH
jgi:hypothetical protein